jgi:hypothetical protein
MKKTLQLFIFVVIYASNAIAANIPTFGDLSKNIIYLNSGKNQLLISNVGDGDNTAQPIVFTGSSSDETVVKVDSVGYKAGDKVAILYLSEQQKAGSAIITVTATDAEGSFQDTKQVQVEQYN